MSADRSAGSGAGRQAPPGGAPRAASPTTGPQRAADPGALQPGTPPLYAALLDDAALFPPGQAPMGEAVSAHLRYRAGPQAPLTGPFVVAAGDLAELGAAVRERTGAAAALAVCVTVPEGPEHIGPALEAAAALPGVEPVAVEVAALGPDGGDAAPANVARAAAALERHLDERCAGFVELPRGADPRRVLDALEATAHRAKLRTGGTRAAAFPGEAELAAVLCAAVERGRVFKCTAGLHHAMRHRAAQTGYEHHGFLNVLLAVHAALGGADPAEVADVLALRDGAQAAAQATALTGARARAVRALFCSLGTCSVLEPLGDLVGLGLLSPAVLE